MMDMDFYTNERLMVQRVEEERRQAEVRRLQREAGNGALGRLFQQRWKVLAQLGHLFVSVGRRLEQAGQVQARSAQEHAGGKA